MEHGVLFDNGLVRKHSAIDWGLVFAPFEIPYPKPKTDFQEIEGGNGSIDLTEAYGKIFYNDTNFTMTFSCNNRLRYEETLNQIVSFVHGKRIKIFVYFDEFFYYDARITVNKYASNKAIGEIVLNITAKPYKLKKLETIEVVDVVDRKVVVFKNERMETLPIFKADKAMNFYFKGNSYAINTTETRFPSVEFVEGDNVVEFVGTGKVEVKYQEGKF